jgi:hypothetical protein
MKLPNEHARSWLILGMAAIAAVLALVVVASMPGQTGVAYGQTGPGTGTGTGPSTAPPPAPPPGPPAAAPVGTPAIGVVAPTATSVPGATVPTLPVVAPPAAAPPPAGGAAPAAAVRPAAAVAPLPRTGDASGLVAQRGMLAAALLVVAGTGLGVFSRRLARRRSVS